MRPAAGCRRPSMGLHFRVPADDVADAIPMQDPSTVGLARRRSRFASLHVLTLAVVAEAILAPLCRQLYTSVTWVEIARLDTDLEIHA